MSDALALWHQSNDNDSVYELFVYPMPESPDSSDLVPTDVEDVSGLAVSMSNLRSSSPISDLNEAQECTGVLVHWTAGSVWDSYPYMQHGIRSLPWEPIGFDGNNKWLRLRSKHCSIILSADALNSRCCRKCTAVPHSSEYRTFVTRAMHAADNTPYSYLSQKQIHALLLRVTHKYRHIVLKVSNY
jgi:hypothetical protein